MCGNIYGNLHHVLIYGHGVAVEIEEQAAGFHPGAFVAIVEDVMSDDVPGQGSRFFDVCGIEVLSKNRGLDGLKYIP